MKISASILAVYDNYLSYAKTLKYANADYLHIDIFQKGKEFSIKDLQKFDSSFLPLDVHLIFETVSEDDIKILNESNVRYVNVQYENLLDKEQIKYLSEKITSNFGIAITSKTPLEVIDLYIDQISQILFMCSEPGVSGAKFESVNYERVNRTHLKYPSLCIGVDGGINDVVGKKFSLDGGVSILVSGSYLSSDMNQIASNIYSLKFSNEKGINVKRNMISFTNLPRADGSSSFMELIDIMNHYKLGIVYIVENQKLLGVVGNGDIRRAFTRFRENVFNKKALDIMNANPFFIDSNRNMDELFMELDKQMKGIDSVPIIADGKLIGALDLRIGQLI